MVGVEGVSKVWLRGSRLQLEFDTHRYCLSPKHFVRPIICYKWYAFPQICSTGQTTAGARFHKALGKIRGEW